ncbi:MAG: type III-A CRISPR-associated protein Csm2 [Comamonadaceae bacterium]|nr:type III-A CRISPR-associated protein Csm2 [Comamonadaceae bacterium]
MPIPNSQIVFGKNLRDDLFSEVAKEKAFEIFQGGLDPRGNQSRNKSTQLRKFYDELVMWADKVQTVVKLEPGQKSSDVREERYRQSAPFIKMMNAKVAYAKGRGHVDESFEAMFSHCIKTISNAETLKHAKLFMEAFMGFYKAQEK